MVMSGPIALPVNAVWECRKRNAGRRLSASGTGCNEKRETQMQLAMIGLDRTRASIARRPLKQGMTAGALLRDPQLEACGGRVTDSGPGRCTLQAAIDGAARTHVRSAALHPRFAPRGKAGFANRVLSVVRHEFGGHAEKSAREST